MRKALVSLAFVGLMSLTMATTCAPRQTYNTLSAVKATTDAAVAGYFDAVVAKQASTNAVPTVAKAYNYFNSVFIVAVDMAKGNSNAVATATVTSASTDVLTAVAVAKGAK